MQDDFDIPDPAGFTAGHRPHSRAHRHESEKQALIQLERAKYKPVAFSVQTNICFENDLDDDAPVHGKAVTFAPKEFLHIKEKYNHEWWIGRIVREGTDLGFIPSPAKLEKLKLLTITKNQKMYPGKNSGGNLDALENMMPSDSPPNTPGPDGEGDQSFDEFTGSGANAQKKSFFKKVDVVLPYEVVPSMRPYIFVGPSLKGYEVTDMMQKAVFDYLKHRFDGRIIITRVSADISLAKKNLVANAATGNRGKPLTEKSNSRQQANLADVQIEIERIFELSRAMQLLVLDCDTINHPSQLQKTALSPFVVYIKIASPKVLQRLIKSRSKSQWRNMNVQMVAAEKLAQCAEVQPEYFDLILEDNQLEEACERLADVMERYWRETHPRIATPPRIRRTNVHSGGNNHHDMIAPNELNMTNVDTPGSYAYYATSHGGEAHIKRAQTMAATAPHDDPRRHAKA